MISDSIKEALSSGRDLPRQTGIDFETLVNLSNDALVLLALDGRPVFTSLATERLLGWSAGKLADHLSDLVYLDTPNSEAEILQHILSGKADPSSPLPRTDVQLRTAFGSLIWVEVNTHLLRDVSGQHHAFAVYFRSISKRKELERFFESVTRTDPITGLFNRRAFEDSLNREWALALREKSHTSLIKVSIDRFEALSEHFGPTAAEDCLIKVASTLKETVRRPADIAARTASSEFSILLPRTHEVGAQTISAYIQMAIQDLGIPNPDNIAGHGVVTASVGAACAVADKSGVSDSCEHILAAAENCVFQARQEGGNRVKTVMNVLTA
ncbi:MAG: sensor domain-containing diguanylate cyclase [Roseibium sp.]|uniref:sensor domain-containing diguanylate cyclase n=1 Tax=Roseibium sp. TaxID=1936156 RepID=UPI0026370CA2|nr:diguanylate cyclase [Roseibium sp.]MCV0429115.1 sensor domain-containing diguanylate cyclase [Roseibium sp.]